jgi:hydroxypyruvate isomerase
LTGRPQTAPEAVIQHHLKLTPDSGLRYASHLGYRSPDPLFVDSVGTLDPKAHIEFANLLGFAGVQYAWAAEQPAAKVERAGQALAACGMEGGSVVFAPHDVVTRPLWTDVTARTSALGHVRHAVGIAKKVHSRTLVVLVTAHADLPLEEQRATLLDNLRAAADIAFSQNIIIGLEPMIALPGMLIRSCAEAYELIREVAHPGVKLVFDTGHVHDMGEDVAASFARMIGEICVLQLADQPGRVEPGAGRLNITAVLTQAIVDQFSSLIELEHGWSSPGVTGERAGLDRLIALDKTAVRLAKARQQPL